MVGAFEVVGSFMCKQRGETEGREGGLLSSLLVLHLGLLIVRRTDWLATAYLAW